MPSQSRPLLFPLPRNFQSAVILDCTSRNTSYYNVEHSSYWWLNGLCADGREGRPYQYWWTVVVLRWDATYRSNTGVPAAVVSDLTNRRPAPRRTRRDSFELLGHQASIFLIVVSAITSLMATFTASSMGSLKGTSIRSRPFS